MKSMKLDIETVRSAYLSLKSYAYQDNLNLFLKQRVAAFESKHVDTSLQKILSVLKSKNPVVTNDFKHWLDEISYHLLPKSVSRTEDIKQNQHNERNGLFISNITSSPQYQVEKVNYFINAPVELHVIEMLWCTVVGSVMDSKLSDDCYGNRLKSFLTSNDNEDKPSHYTKDIFKRYVDQYNQWRDQAIEIASNLADKEEDVALLSLDLKSYFYHVDFDFNLISDFIEQNKDSFADLELAKLLTEALEKVHDTYNYITYKSATLTHPDCQEKFWLPIGMASSAIIANWYLSEFDKDISNKVRPSYYGRYVDDILLVFRRPNFEQQNPIESFIEQYFNNLLERDKGPKADYFISIDQNKLPIQRDKLILQYFDKNHSKAGLDIFKQELEERSSAFKFLPTEHIDKELDKFAYDILYDGSANKLRSIVGLAENETELSKYLSSHITAHRLCRLDYNSTVIPDIQLFFRGANALQFNRLWEKVYQYALVTKRYDFIFRFVNTLESEIKKIRVIHPTSKRVRKRLTTKLHKDMELYNHLSLSLTVALLDIAEPPEEGTDEAYKVFLSSGKDKLAAFIFEKQLAHYSWSFRKSNLLRHHLVSWPLANFADFNGDLTNEESFLEVEKVALCAEKIKMSPRFIHLDEWQLFKLPDALHAGKQLVEWQKSSLISYEEKIFSQKLPADFEPLDDKSNVKSTFTVGSSKSKQSIRLALANMVVDERDIDSSLRKDKRSNVSYERQKRLYQLLNSALKEQAELLIMPEVAIPVTWLPFMVAHSRRHQIGLIFGLEHWVVGNQVYNLIIEVLPFKTSNKYKSCAISVRLKNHYAPSELELIDSLRLTPANMLHKPKNYYHKVNWNGVSFTTYNCFELSDIEHRTLFKSEVDMIFACVWNKDTNYYQHILESAVRDLHCYVVQSNTSQYGGSCVLRPSKTFNKTMLYVKGGNNACVLTTDIDIQKLREFQYKSRPGAGDSFKHLPPGYDCEKVISR